MHLLLVGISHRTAPVELRERLDFQTRGVDVALRALSERRIAREAAVLSTCNRAEIYAVCEDVATTRDAVVSFLSQFHGVERSLINPHEYDVADQEVARHLFRVASGLDSLVVGEPQILGQVKEAHTAATDAHASGPILNRLFHASFAAGKRVRTETGLGSGAVSVSFAAVALSKKIFGALKGRSVLVIGAGEMGKLTAMHMKSQGVQHITILSRTMAHAARTAQAIGGASAAPWEDLDAQLAAADIVITATGAAAPILTKGHLETVMRSRRSGPLFIIDIALPRDVEATAGELEQVFLYNIDDLQATVRENMARRSSEVERAEAIVGEEVERFTAWLRSRGAIPTVVALRQHFDSVRRSELDRMASHLPSEVRQQLDDITRRMMEKLLLTPTEQLKAIGDAETIGMYSEALGRIFNLPPVAEPAATAAPSDDAAGSRKVEPFVTRAELGERRSNKR